LVLIDDYSRETDDLEDGLIKITVCGNNENKQLYLKERTLFPRLTMWKSDDFNDIFLELDP